jgi:hypothetical protein
MTRHAGVPHIKRKWYRLAKRHLRMAARLLRDGFSDGAFFHSYHAFECAISAIIAAKNYPVPPDGKRTIYAGPKRRKFQYYPAPSGQLKELSSHKVRFLLFDELADHSKSYYTIYQTLSRILTKDERNDSLYYDHTTDRLPHEQFKHSQVEPFYTDVREFVREVWNEIK